MKRVDICIVEVTGPSGRGKSTLAVALGLSYAVVLHKPIVSNMTLRNLPDGVESTLAQRSADLLTTTDKVMIWDEPYNSFPSDKRYAAVAQDKKLTELVSTARKRDVPVIVFTTQLKRAVKNTLRQNAKFAVIPTGTLFDGKYPEFLLWNDIEQFEQTRDSGSYNGGELEHADYSLEYLDTTFNTRETIVVEW